MKSLLAPNYKNRSNIKSSLGIEELGNWVTL